MAEFNHSHCAKEYCECIYVLSVKLGSVVELIVIDEGYTFAANHPMHLHGQHFRVVGMGKVRH